MRAKGDTRDKSCNITKKGKHFIEITKITTCKNASGLFTSVERNTPNIERKKERAFKNLGKFRCKKSQYSHRAPTDDKLDPKTIRKRKNRISIGSLEKSNLRPQTYDSENCQQVHNLSKEFVDTFFHNVDKEESKIPLEEQISQVSPKKSREDAKSTPKNEDFLPNFGCNKDNSPQEKKIKSKDERINSHRTTNKVPIDEKYRRDNSKKLSIDLNFKKNYLAKANNLKVMSSSNSSRSQSKEKNKNLGITINPVSNNHFKHAIGNLPVKANRDDDMLFSFRNQVVANKSNKESESSPLSESINSRHGQITYLLTSLEDKMASFLEGFKL